MNTNYDGTTVSFKSESEELFLAEKSGAKPNTVRIIDHSEQQQLKKKLPEKIEIRHGQGIFLRTLTHVYVSEMVLGKYIAIFSWTNEKHLHTMSGDHGLGDHTLSLHTMSGDHGLGDHTLSLDLTEEPHIDRKGVDVTISKNLHRLLESIAHGRSMNSIIQEMYDVYLYRRYEEIVREPLHD